MGGTAWQGRGLGFCLVYSPLGAVNSPERRCDMEFQKENIPDDLKNYKNWVLWRYETRDGRKTKIPYSTNGERAKSNDPATWASFGEVCRLAARYNGIGFMFSNSPFVGIDVDHCLDTAEHREAAAGMIEDCKSYAEVSPSGTGIHIIGRAELEKGFRHGNLEVYPSGRYFTVTGNVFDGKALPVGDIQGAVDDLRKYVEQARAVTSGQQPAGQQPEKQQDPEQSGADADPQNARHDARNARPSLMDAAAIVKRIRESKKAPQFTALYDNGDTSAYGGDESAADMALMNMLPFWTDGDAALMESIFTSSALGRREKWQRRGDYRERTIQAALRSWNGEQYGQQAGAVAERVGSLSEDQRKRLAHLPATDTGNAERLKTIYGDKLKFLPEKGRGAAWMKWDGKKWACTYESGLYNMVSAMAAVSYRAANTLIPVDVLDHEAVKAKKALLGFLARTGNQKQIDSCLKRARGLFGASITDFDKDGYLLNVQNGTLNLRTGKLLPHDLKRMCSKICRASYPEQRPQGASLWEQTVATIIPDEQERHYLQKWAGYMLLGSAPEEKLLFLYGEGGTGKGTFINTIGYMLGDYADTVDIEMFLTSRNDGHAGGAAPSPEIAKLAGVRLAVASESGLGRKLNDAKVKNMTGRDDLTARYLYGQQFTFSPVVKFVLQSNYLPAVLDANDTGVRRRLVIAPFMEDLDKARDPMLKERLKEPENLAGVLAWCVDGCLMWQKEGLGEPPERFQQEAARFYEDSDTLQQFLDERCATGPKGSKARVKVKALCEAYQDWLGEPIKRKTIIALMKRKKYIPHRYNDVGQCFDGLELLKDV